MKFAYAAEKFSNARRLLMLPHPSGEAQAIASAFLECSMCLHNLRPNDLGDDGARRALLKFLELMNTEDVDDPEDRGRYIIKAEQLTLDQRFELSRAVDELASWFDAEFTR